MTLQFDAGWWSDPVTVGLWALVSAGLMVSRIPTLSFKTVRVRPRLVAPLLVLVGLVAAVVVTAPFLGLAIGALAYLAHIPYAAYLHRWMGRHPEAWHVPVRDRRAVARAARSARRLGLRPPLRRRVAGRASAVARAVRRFGDDSAAPHYRSRPVNGHAPGPAPTPQRPTAGNRLRLGLRRTRRR